MNVLDQKSETCTSESGCATSVDKSLSEEEKKSSVKSNDKSNDKQPSDEVVMAKSKGPWTEKEHSAFLEGLEKYGMDWKQIAAYVKSRNAEEVERHFHSFQKEEPFIFRLRKMLDDKSLDKIIAWVPHGRSFVVFNRACVKVALPLYFGKYFDMNQFQRELYKYGFCQDLSRFGFDAGIWFHSNFCRDSLLGLRGQASKSNVCSNKFCNGNTNNLMKCTGCRNVHYCSLACQHTDWPFHMWVCGEDMSGNDKLSGTGTSHNTNDKIIGDDKPRGTSTSTSKKSHNKNTPVISKMSKQRKGKPITISKSKITLKDDIKTNTGEWSVGEHCLFLEGLERYGRSWKDVASHVKTRTAVQVSNHAKAHLKKIDCYWTTTEHQLFLEGLDQYGRGRWVEIATHVETKDNKQVSFHAKEYFEEEEMNTKSEKKDSSVEDSVKKSAREWSAEEHDRFLEGLERHGRSWKDVASHVETRTRVQVNGHAYRYLKKIDCYWTTKEHQLFLEGLEQYGRGRWVEIATHVETKNKEQVSFHAKEYFEEEEMNGESQKMVGNSDKHSIKLVKKPNHNLINVTSRNAKRSIDQVGDSKSTTSKRRITKLSIKQKSDEQSIVTPEKNTGLECGVQNVIDGRGETNLFSPNETDSDMLNKGKWTEEEHRLFLEGLELYGTGEWKKIASHVQTRSNRQVNYHAGEYFSKTQITKTGKWTDEEQCLFIEGLGLYGKGEWKKIASHVRTRTWTQVRKHFTRTLNDETKSLKSEDMPSYNACQDVEDKTEKEEVINSKKSSVSDDIATPDIDDTSCPICLEKLSDPHIVPECCHRFCKGCIEEALEYRRECPICRGRVTSRRALRRDEVFGNLLRLSEEYKVNNMAASAKLQEKNYRIQHIESRQKEDENRLENVNRAFQRLEKELKEKNSKIESFENLVQTLFDRNKGKLERIANEVKDLQTQLQQKNQTIYDLQVQLHENDDRIYDLQSHLQENDYVIYDLQSHLQENDYVIYDLKSQLHENDHRIQYLESKGKVDEDKRQFVSEANKHLETQLEEEKTRSNALWKLSRTLYDKHNIESMAAELREVQSQLQEKNERIQHLESREKTDEERLEHVKHLEKTFEDLQALLDEKNERIQYLESREKTEEERLEHVEHLEKTFGDLQALLDEKNERIHYLESREKADKEKIQCLSKSSEHLETQVEEKNARIEVLEELARTLGDEHEIESMATAVRDLQSQLQEKQSQLQEKNDKIQKLESKQKADEERLEHITKAIEYLEKEVEEKNAEIRILEEIRTHSDVHKLESMAAAVKDLQSQLQEKNVRIQLLESRKQKVEVIEEEKTIDLPLVFDTNDMPGQAAENETKRGSIHSKPKTPEQELAALETSGVPLFLIKTYQLISTCSDQLADWSDNGETFTVKDTAQFAKVEIPKYFNHNNFSSFSRQLNFYGFSKVSLKTIRVDHVRFHNQNFRKGKIHLLSKIKRSTGKKANVNHAQEIKESSKKKTLGIPIFLQKTYHMIDSCDPTIASWSDSGDSFAVKDPDTFAKNIIPQFFKHNNFKSFVRQLNVYGFRKIKNEPIKISIGEEGPESKYCRFRHEFFLRGRPDLLCEIKKVDNSQGADQDVVNALKNEVTSLKGQLAAMRGEMEKAVNMIKTMSQNKQEADETMSAAPIHPAIGSCDEEPMAEVEISFETPLEAIDVTKPTQEACVKEKEETRVQTKDDENVMNANTEAKW